MLHQLSIIILFALPVLLLVTSFLTGRGNDKNASRLSRLNENLGIAITAVWFTAVATCFLTKTEAKEQKDFLAVKFDLLYYLKEQTTNPDAYEQMHRTFYGTPSSAQIQTYINGIMDNYQLPKTNDEALKIGHIMVAYRQKSNSKFTEIQLLQDIYANADPGVSLNEAITSSVSHIAR